MLVKEWMSKEVITIDAGDFMQNAINLLRQNEIRMLPVTDKNSLVGVITDRDIKRASISTEKLLDEKSCSDLYSKVLIRDIMTQNPITAYVDFTLEETAEVLLVNKISGVPIIDYEHRMRGIITQSDIFRAFVLFTGVGKKGTQFAVDVIDRPSCVKEVSEIIRAYAGRISNIIVSQSRAPSGHLILYVRAYNIEGPKLKRLEEKLAEKFKLLYIMDHDTNQRKIF